MFFNIGNAFPAKLGETPPVRIVTFSDSSWGKSLLSDFPGPSGIPAENFRRDRAQSRKTSRHACRRHGGGFVETESYTLTGT